MQHDLHLSVRRTARAATTTHSGQALLLRRVEYGDSDLILTLLSEGQGRITALARGARKGSKRFGGVLEPMHTLVIRYDERPGAELVTLREAKIQSARAGILTSLERLQAAGTALGWVRKAAPPRVPEPEVWLELSALLDQLASAENVAPRALLAASGLRLLVAFGWGIDLARCVSCGKAAALNQAAAVDPGRGGLVCRSCGGARIHLSGPEREALSAASSGQHTLNDDEAQLALRLVEHALKSHGGIE